MAKVIGGLFSVEASGQFAKSLVFDKRGIVREYKVPRNAKTLGQGNQRQRMAAITKALGIIDSEGVSFLTEQAQAIAPESYRWRPYLLGLALKSVQYSNAQVAFNALDATGQTAWDTAATTAGITPTELDYAQEDTITPGRALFIFCHSIHANPNINSVPMTVPGAANAQDWRDWLTGA